MNPPVPVIIAGPTASGKSAIAIELAKLIGGEIISADSMQVYRGLNIGTAKPSLAQQAAIPHHLIDIIDLTEAFDAAQFAERAERACTEIADRGKIPILCGGTGLYFNAWLHGVGTAPGSDPALRAELESTPMEILLSELRTRDPVTFNQIDKSNPRRVVRSVEAIRLSGQAFSEQRADWNKTAGKKALTFIVEREPADLQNRIDARVEQMFAAGLIEETRQLLPLLQKNKTAAQAIGYRQVMEHLAGNLDATETLALVKSKTRQYAKRQRTWFKHQLPGVAIFMRTADSPASGARTTLSCIDKSPVQSE